MPGSAVGVPGCSPDLHLPTARPSLSHPGLTGLQWDGTAVRFQPWLRGVRREAVPSRGASLCQPCTLCPAMAPSPAWGSRRHLQGSPRAGWAGWASLGQARGAPRHAVRLARHLPCQPAPGVPRGGGCAGWSVSLLLVLHPVPACGWGVLGGQRGPWLGGRLVAAGDGGQDALGGQRGP